MKGLLRKDLIMIWKYGKMLLLMSVIFLFAGMLSDDENFFFVVYPVLLAGVLPATMISYEERWGWNSYCDAMPLSRRTVVSARYVATLLCFLVLYALTLLGQAVALLPKGRSADLLQLAMILPGFGLTPPSVMIPIMLRWGVEKGRIAYFIIVGGMVAGGLTLFNSIRDVAAQMPLGFLTASIPGAVLLFAFSWLLSIRLYENREL